MIDKRILKNEHTLKVLEYGDLVSAPYCSKLMSDLDATVIKVEEPGMGDCSRRWGPFKNDIPNQEASGLFLYLNNNKWGITLNLRTATGVEIFKRLLTQVDVLVENKPPCFWAELGLGYEAFSSINPLLIMTSITPFGQTGPYKDYQSSELINIQMSGMGYGTPGQVEDIENFQPLKVTAIQLDFLAGVVGALATRLSLINRKFTQKGQHIDISVQEVGIWVGMSNFAQYFYCGLNPTRVKGGYEMTGPMHTLPCKDGYVHLECMEEVQWHRLVEMLGNPEWAKLEVFKNLKSRGENWDALRLLIVNVLKEWKAEDFTRKAQAAGVPCTVVRKPSELVSSLQNITPEFFKEIDHVVAGKILYPGMPFRLSTIPPGRTRPAPLLGEHNKDIICGELGFPEKVLPQLNALGVI